jgi:hypothetical protein
MSIVKVKVVDEYVEVKAWEKNGKSGEMHFQNNVFHDFKGETRKVPLQLQKNQKPYAPGQYTFDTDLLLTIGRFGYEVDRFAPLVLVPVVEKSFINKVA